MEEVEVKDFTRFGIWFAFKVCPSSLELGRADSKKTDNM